MGLTAALCGLLTALVPVLFTMIHDGLPTRLVAAGLVHGSLRDLADHANTECGGGPDWRDAFAEFTRSRLTNSASDGRTGRGRIRQPIDPSQDGRRGQHPLDHDLCSRSGVLGLAAVLMVVSLNRAGEELLKGSPNVLRSGFLGLGILAGSLDTAGEHLLHAGQPPRTPRCRRPGLLALSRRDDPAGDDCSGRKAQPAAGGRHRAGFGRSGAAERLEPFHIFAMPALSQPTLSTKTKASRGCDAYPTSDTDPEATSARSGSRAAERQQHSAALAAEEQPYSAARAVEERDRSRL